MADDLKTVSPAFKLAHVFDGGHNDGRRGGDGTGGAGDDVYGEHIESSSVSWNICYSYGFITIQSRFSCEIFMNFFITLVKYMQYGRIIEVNTFKQRRMASGE